MLKKAIVIAFLIAIICFPILMFMNLKTYNEKNKEALAASQVQETYIINSLTIDPAVSVKHPVSLKERKEEKDVKAQLIINGDFMGTKLQVEKNKKHAAILLNVLKFQDKKIFIWLEKKKTHNVTGINTQLKNVYLEKVGKNEILDNNVAFALVENRHSGEKKLVVAQAIKNKWDVSWRFIELNEQGQFQTEILTEKELDQKLYAKTILVENGLLIEEQKVEKEGVLGHPLTKALLATLVIEFIVLGAFIRRKRKEQK